MILRVNKYLNRVTHKLKSSMKGSMGKLIPLFSMNELKVVQHN